MHTDLTTQHDQMNSQFVPEKICKRIFCFSIFHAMMKERNRIFLHLSIFCVVLADDGSCHAEIVVEKNVYFYMTVERDLTTIKKYTNKHMLSTFSTFSLISTCSGFFFVPFGTFNAWKQNQTNNRVEKVLNFIQPEVNIRRSILNLLYGRCRFLKERILTLIFW